MSRLRRELGLGVLFSAHELNPLLGAMDRVLYVGLGRAVQGAVDDVITGPALSRLTGSPIEALRVGRRILVMSAAVDAEAEAHRHDHREPMHVRL